MVRIYNLLVGIDRGRGWDPVSNDYLKQLQLTKQLEQKTKEAAKNRKEAEERMAVAEKAISSAKAVDAVTSAADKFMEEARQAFNQKDYKLALSQAQKALEASDAAKKDKAASILESAASLLRLFEDSSVPKEIRALQSTSSELLEKGSVEETINKSRETWDAVERFVNSKVADMFSTAQSQILVAEKMDLEVEGQRQMLIQARRSLEKDDFQRCISQVKDCLEMGSTALRNHFQSRAEGLGIYEERADELGIDFSKPSETLRRGKTAADEGDFELAFGTLNIAESEARATVSKGLLSKLEGLKERTAVLKSMGAEVGELSSAIARGRELARGDKIEEGMDAWREAEGLVRTEEIERLLDMISRLRGRLMIANRIGSDITVVLTELDAARKTLSQGDFKMAVALVNRAEVALEKTLEGYKEVEAELTRTRNLMGVAVRFNLNVGEARRRMDTSRQMVLHRDFDRAIKTLLEAQEIVHSAIQAHIAQDIMRAEMRVTTALKIGADIQGESALLEEVVARTKSAMYDKITEDLELCVQKVDAKVHRIAEATIAEAGGLLDAYTGPIDTSPSRNTLKQAQEVLDEGQSMRAYDLAISSMEMMRRDERNALDLRLEEARYLLSVVKETGSESITLNDKLERAVEMRFSGNVTESLRLVEEVSQFARSMIESEVTKRLTQLNRDVVAARRSGIEMLQAERLAEEGSLAVGKGDLLRGYSLLKEGETSLERLTAVHNRIYERIVEIAGMLKEADEQKLDTSKQKELLSHAKQLFEAGRYEEALPAIAKTYVETEKLVAPFIAPRKAQAAQDLIQVAKRLGFEVTAPQKRLDSCLRLIERKEYAQAMISVREVEKTVVSVLTKGVERELVSTKGMLEKAKVGGSDVSGPQQMVLKAESLLRERRIYDALRALELAKNELDQGLLMNEKASDAMERAQAIINDAKEFGVEMGAAQELLRQARNYHKMGRHGIAYELANKAGEQADASAAEMLRQRLQAIEAEYKPQGLDGQDLQATLRIKTEVQSRLQSRRFREAVALVKSFEEELGKVKAEKELATRSLAEVMSKMVEGKKRGLTTAAQEMQLSEAMNKLSVGAYYESLTISARCADELRDNLDQYDRRLAELHELEQLWSELNEEGVGDKVKELARQASRSLSDLDFANTALIIRRGKEAAMEAFNSIQTERMKSLDNMCSLAEELKLSKSAVPKVVKEVTSLRGTGEKPDPKKLRKALEAMDELLRKKLEARMEAVQEEVDKARGSGVDVTVSTDLLTRAKIMLADGKLRGSVNCVMEADRSIGVAVDEQHRYVEQRRKVEASIENARRNGLEMAEAIGLYREAEKVKEKDHAAAVLKMAEAVQAAERAAEEFMPDIQVDLHFLDPLTPGKWSKARLNLSNEAKAMAREVTVGIGGDLEMRGFVPLPKLRGGERLSLGVEVKPKLKGMAHATLSLECRPVLSNDKVGYDSEFQVEVS